MLIGLTPQLALDPNGQSTASTQQPEGKLKQKLDQRIAEAKSNLEEEGRLYRSVITAIVVCAILLVLNHFTAPASVWSLWVAGIWFALLVIRGMRTFVFRGLISRWQQKRLRQMLRR